MYLNKPCEKVVAAKKILNVDKTTLSSSVQKCLDNLVILVLVLGNNYIACWTFIFPKKWNGMVKISSMRIPKCHFKKCVTL